MIALQYPSILMVLVSEYCLVLRETMTVHPTNSIHSPVLFQLTAPFVV